MFSDLDKSSAYILRRSFKETSLDVCDEDTLKYSALYEDLLRKKDSIDKQGYIAPALLPIGKDGVVNIRLLLPFEGVHFINMAYMVILGRVPEKAAMDSLQKALAANSSKEAKIKILRTIGSSNEAKSRGAILTGYDKVKTSQLYRYQDMEFIENAYIRILLRRPDDKGRKRFLSMLRSPEYSPAEILYTLRHSPEGEKHGVEIVGLENDYRRRMKRKKIMSIPVIGRCIRYISRLLGVNRRILALKNEISYLWDKLYSSRSALDDRINSLTLQLSDRIDAGNRKTAALERQIREQTGRINKLAKQYETENDRLAELAERYETENDRLAELAEEYETANSRLTELAERYENANSRYKEQYKSVESRLTELDDFTHQTDSIIGELNKTQDEHYKLLNEQSDVITRLSEESDRRSTFYETRFGELDGYTHQIGDNVNALNSSMERYGNTLNDQSAAITRLSEELDRRSSSYESSFRELDGYTHQIEDNVSDLNSVSESYGNLLNEQSDAITRLSQELDKRSTSYESSFGELDGYTHQIGGNVADINKALSNYDNILSEYVNEDKKTIQMLLAEIFKLKTEIKALKNGGVRNAEAAPSQSEETAPSAVPASDVYSAIEYFDFENHFRGSREHVKSVQKIYLPYFEGRKNVLDLGCGRGEFTELLRDNNVGVTGVDMYEPYVEYMRSLELPVVLDDAVAYLSRQESTDGIFMGQVVEHLSVDQIVTICNMAYEKLEEGSCLIMETPNPKSLAIFTECFYMDPSHQKPVHPFTLKYIAEKAGFTKVDILYTDSSRLPFSIPKIKEDEPDFDKFNEAMQRVSELLYGSQDYAVIARK
ncbi:MAG: methyltransferase domain-containing protein [Huintestinicola sp.]